MPILPRTAPLGAARVAGLVPFAPSHIALSLERSGRFDAYAAVSPAALLRSTSYLCGLRQNPQDRSNVAIQNAGTGEDGDVTLRLTIFSNDSGTVVVQPLPDQTLSPGEFRQFSGILISHGLIFKSGYVKIERISGNAPYHAYGVINDEINSDGSFIPPVPQAEMAGETAVTLPVVVENAAFSTELVLTNYGETPKNVRLTFVADGVENLDRTATLVIPVEPGQQWVLPHFVQNLRDQNIPGIGSSEIALAGALFATADTVDLDGIFLAGRTSTPGGGGRYGVFYTAIPARQTLNSRAWIHGMRQDGETRANLALVNTGTADTGSNTFRVDLFDGASGAKVNTVEETTVPARGWLQIGAILSQHGMGVTEGYARVTRTAGANPFIVYGVINDGGQPGERTGDGAFVSSSP